MTSRRRLADRRPSSSFDRAFLVLCAQVFVLSVGQGLIVPILPLYARSFGVNATMVGLLLAAQAFPRIFANVPAGRLADRFGAHRLLAVAAMIACLAALGAAAAGSYWWLLVTRVVQGIGGAVSHTAGLTYTATLSPRETQGRHIALYQGSFLVGVGIGPVIGGVVAQTLGYRAPFVGFAAAAGVTAVWVLRQLPDPRPVSDAGAPGDGDAEQEPAGPSAGSSRRLLAHPAVAWACVFGFVAAYTRTSTRDFGIVLVAADTGAGEAIIGAAMSVVVLGNVAVLYLAGTLTDRYGAKRMIAFSWVFTAVGMAMFAVANTHTSLFLAAGVYGLAAGLGNPVPAIYIVNHVAREHLGAALGTYRAVNDLGMIVGPLAMGAMVTLIGVRLGLQVNVAIVVVATVVFLAAHRPSTDATPRGPGRISP